MRIVIYDDESFEAVTVINVPGLTDRAIETHQRRWRVPVPTRFSISEITIPAKELCVKDDMQVVELEFEPIIRRTAKHGDQRHWLCFTRAADLAMKLNPSWLPGQRPAIDEIQRQNDRLTELLLNGMRLF